MTINWGKFKFTSQCLWGAFIVSFPYVPLTLSRLIDPRDDLIRNIIPLSVIIASGLVFASLAKKEKQTIFALIVAIIVLTIAFFPLIYRPPWPPPPILSMP